MLTDTLLVNGADLQSVTGVVISSMADTLRDGPFRGENLTLPGRPGDLGVVKVRAAYSFDVPITLLGIPVGGVYAATIEARRTQFLANLDALHALFPSNLVTLTRVLQGRPNKTCNAEWVPETSMDMLNTSNGRTVLQFINLDGAWL